MTPVEAFIKATKFRGKAYYFFYEELTAEVGADKAEEIMSKATYKLGIDKANSFSEASASSAKAFALEFVKDEIGSKVFVQKILSSDKDEAVIEMKGCPLVDMWKEMGLSKDQVKKMCDIAYRIDFGTVEGKGFDLEFPKGVSCGDESCVLSIRRL